MTLIQNPIIGRAKNQAGGMVFSTVHGQNVLRAKPFQYRDKNSTTQQQFRGLFLLLVRLAATAKFFISDFFQTLPSRMSCYSKLISQLRPAFVYVTDHYVFKPKDIFIGNGNMDVPDDYTTTVTPGVDIDFEWPDELISQSDDASDKVYYLFTDAAGTDFHLYDTGKTRADSTHTLALPLLWGHESGFISKPIFKSVKNDGRTPIILSDTDTPSVYTT